MKAKSEPSVPVYQAVPAGSARGGILVLPAWWGLNPFFKSLCDRLAGEGYLALAPDLYHGRVAATVAEAQALRSTLKAKTTQGDLRQAVERLAGSPALAGRKLAVIGFSLGARWALDLVEDQPDRFSAVVLFYGTRGGEFVQAQAAFLGHFAETDTYVADSGVKKLQKTLRATDKTVEFYTYPGVGHWFFESDRPDAYNRPAAELAWQRTVAFLQIHLG